MLDLNDQLRLDQTDINLKKLELKIANVFAINSGYSQTLLNLLVKKGIITEAEFDAENKLVSENNETNKLIKEIENDIDKMQETFDAVMKDLSDKLKAEKENKEDVNLSMAIIDEDGNEKPIEMIQPEKKEDEDGE